MLWTNNNNISKSSSSTFLVNILSFIISVIFFGFVYTLFLQEYQNRNLFFLILFLFLLICNLIFYKFTRKIFDNLYSKTPLHILIISILFSLFIGLFITTFYPVEIPKLKLLSQQLEITATSDKNHYSTDNKVVVEGFIIDGEYVSYNQFHHDGRWVRTNNRLIFSGNESNTLKWKGHPSNSVLIIKTGPDCGKSIINWNGYIELFDLYSDDESEILIHHDHYSSPLNRLLSKTLIGLGFSIIYFFLLSFTMIAFSPKFYSYENTLEAFCCKKHKCINMFKLFPILIILSISAIVYIAYTQKLGLIVGGDSINYICAARHLIQGNGYIALDGDVFNWWTPLYPAVLSLFEILPYQSTIFIAYRIMNGMLFVFVIFLTCNFLSILFSKNKIKPYNVLFLFVFSIPLLNSSFTILSDLLFVILTLIFLISLINSIVNKNVNNLSLLIFSCVLLPLTRYIGVVHILVASILIFFHFKSDLKLRLLRIFFFGLVTGIPFGLWLLRNYQLTNLLTGFRNPSKLTIFDNISLTLNTIKSWYIPDYKIIAIIFLSFIISTIFFSILLKYKAEIIINENIAQNITLFFVFVYSIWLIISLSFVMNAPIGDRLLLPIYIPLTLLIIYYLNSLISNSKVKKHLNLINSFIVVFILIQPLFFIIEEKQNDIVTNSDSFSIHFQDDNSLISKLKRNSLKTDIIYSNCPKCISLFTGIMPIVEFESEEQFCKLFDENKNGTIIWFDNIAMANSKIFNAYNPESLTCVEPYIKQFNKVYSSSDGDIYQYLPINN